MTVQVASVGLAVKVSTLQRMLSDTYMRPVR